MKILHTLLMLIFLALSLEAQVKTVTKVFGSSPPMTYLIYAINPDKLVGLNFKPQNANNNANETYLKESFLSQPVIGSFHGGGKSINLETLMAKNPDLILLWEDDMLVSTVQKSLQKTKFPTLSIPFREIEDIPFAISKTAQAMDEQERGKLLSNYSSKIITEIQTTLKDTKPVRYYYAEGVDGLSTECDKSFHVEAFNFAGGENVHKCQQNGILGLEKISFETLLVYNPEVIIAQNSFVYNQILYDDMFAHLSAVKNKRVYLVPNTPFNWVDRPPSFMRLIGVQWLTQIFHPELYKIDLDKRMQEFYELFFDVKIDKKQIQKILGDE